MGPCQSGGMHQWWVWWGFMNVLVMQLSLQEAQSPLVTAPNEEEMYKKTWISNPKKSLGQWWD